MHEDRGVADVVRGPASYFPSIERTYGRPVEDWLTMIRQRPAEGHMATVAVAEVGARDGVTATPTRLVGHVRAQDRG